ncbi:DAK2 domain-containing protein [Mycoplasmopsis ciconiae]|uniref:DAK2 domain-containing protein n=1 Tax=Mycoplasmopsis ciconiae TaxID=561067 RepID=A0ABU7MN37_9BACT|nr:DAK2 domain-containing protein [Mycoplasmopsis ciconiae]
MNREIDGIIWSKALISGANNLINQKNRIDALNVFPVPDGDTGTNMASTIEAAIDFLSSNQEKNVDFVCDNVARNMLFGARGNSGVILSQIFRGFANGVNQKDKLNVSDLGQCFYEASKKAYSAVLNPIEGTILTVIRETSEEINKFLKSNSTVDAKQFFQKVVEFARISCDNTPNKLKTLREVGVTDSGGEGLFLIFEGILSYFEDKPIAISNDNLASIDKFVAQDEVFEGEFGYCTEFIVDLSTPEKFNQNKFQLGAEKLATSLVIVQDKNILKVHGHTIKPGTFLNFAQKFGEFMKIKSENMTLQANNSKAAAQELKSQKNENEKKNPCGIISCNLGSGIIERMKEFECDYIVESGQTQNPSAQDLITAINNVNAETVFILPNNSNILLVSQQAAQVITDKNVIIIPTKTQIQGLNAILNFNKETSAEENAEIMNEAILDVISAEITQAVRTTKINNVDIKKDEFIGILNNKIVTSQKTFIDATKEVISIILDDNPSKELLSLYYGDSASETDANEILSWVQNNYDIEVEIFNGNQPNYHFLIGVE